VFIVVFIVLMLVMLNLPHSLLNEGGSSDTNGAANSSYSSGNGTRSITWKYDGDTYTLKFSIDQAKYLNYVNNPVARRMTSNNDYALGLQFITSNDSLILSIAAQLSSLKDQAGLDRSGRPTWRSRSFRRYPMPSTTSPMGRRTIGPSRSRRSIITRGTVRTNRSSIPPSWRT